MKMLLSLAALAAASCLYAEDGAGQQKPGDGRATPVFSPADFRAHVTFLAEDILEGRQTGSRGHEIAAHYVAAQLAAAGLTPAGTGGSWYQQVKMRESRLVAGSARVTIGAKVYENGEGVVVGPTALEQVQDIGGSVVFAGHCLYEPKLKVDDFKGLDLAGKIVACLPGFPPGLPSETAAYLSNQRSVFVAKRGGIGIVTLWTKAQTVRRPFKKMVAGIDSPRMALLTPGGDIVNESPGLRTSASLSPEASAALFAGAPRSFAAVDAAGEKGAVKGFDLKQPVRIVRQSSWKAIESPNVVGMVKGTDPALAAQIVVLGGHLDHLGIGTPVNGDAIYNGALDNAAGSATLIEVAKATAAAPPKRSVLFVATTAEEKGLLGAQYYAENPTVPKEAVVAMIDLDMPVLTYKFTDVVAYGAEHSSIAQFVGAAAEEIGLKITPDPLPLETIFVRSDHYKYVTQGVPAIMLTTGVLNGGEKAYNEFLATQYHQPSDDLALPIDWASGARFAELNWRIMERMANSAQPPRWYEGDYFADLFAPDAPRVAAPAPGKR